MDLKYDTNEHIYKTDVQNRLVAAKGKGAGGGMNWEFGIGINTLLYVVVHVLHVLLIQVTTWRNRQEIMLSEKS